MLQSPITSITVGFLRLQASGLGSRRRRGFNVFAGLALACVFSLLLAVVPDSALAQDWGEESNDDWSQPTPRHTQSAGRELSGWSFRAGVGFTDGPDSLLLNFELPYSFDQWVAAGPMLQIGTSDHNTIAAPSMNVTVTIPDLPGEYFDRVHPFGTVGLGFAYIEDDNRQNDNSSVGFLIDFGIGVELQVSEQFFIGSQMMFNFLPEQTLEQNFFFSWQVGGVRIAF